MFSFFSLVQSQPLSGVILYLTNLSNCGEVWLVLVFFLYCDFLFYFEDQNTLNLPSLMYHLYVWLSQEIIGDSNKSLYPKISASSSCLELWLKRTEQRKKLQYLVKEQISRTASNSSSQ